MTRDEWRRKYDENISLFTYPAVADYLQRGNVETEKGRNDEGRMTRGI